MLEKINTSMLELKGLDCFFTSSKGNNISNNEKAFLNCLKQAKSNTSKTDGKNNLPKDLKPVKMVSKEETIKNKSTKDKTNVVMDKEKEEVFEELEGINEQIVAIILNLMELNKINEIENVEVIEEDAVQLLEEIESFVMKVENELDNNVDLEFSEENIELLQNVTNNLTKVKDLLLNPENEFVKQLDENIVSKMETQILEFEEKLKPVMNKTPSLAINNEMLSKVDSEEQEELDNTKVFSTDDEIVFEKKETQDIKVEEKTEVPEEKLEENKLNTSESFEEFPAVNTKAEQTFDKKADNIINKEIKVPKEEVLKQIIDKGKAIINSEKSEIRIKLKPEILGDLVLKVELEKGAVVAKAIVDNYRVKELLEANIYQLKEGLEEQGMEIKAFEVQVGSNSDFEKQNRQNTFSNSKKKKIKIKQLDLDDLNLYEENTISYGPSIGSESKLDLMA